MRLVVEMKKVIYILTVLSLLVSVSFSKDIIHLANGETEEDKRFLFPHIILFEALNITKDSYGEYSVSYIDFVSRKRALRLLEDGKYLNVHGAVTQKEWEEKAIPIYIPMKKGLLSYRFFLIKEKNQEKFAKELTLDELKKYSAGLGAQWSITKVMRANNFTVESCNRYEGLFEMLEKERFDYFPRGINEIFYEEKVWKQKYNDIMIEPTKALYMPIPYYLFVSPKNKKLAKRIEEGIHKIIENGRFEELFNLYYKETLEKANLSQRVIYKVPNPTLSDKTPLHVEKYWFK